MGVIDTVLTILLNCLYAALFLAGVRYMYMAYFFILRKNKIIQVRSQVAAYKLKIRTRLNHILSGVVVGGPRQNEEISEIVDVIKKTELTQASDYQLLLNQLARLAGISASHTEIAQNEASINEKLSMSVVPEAALAREQYQAVFKLDPELIVFIVELTKHNAEYIRLAHEYNQHTQQEKNIEKVTDIPEKIHIEHIYILEELCSRHKLTKEKEREEKFRQKTEKEKKFEESVKADADEELQKAEKIKKSA